MKKIEKGEYDVLKQYGKYVLVAATVAFGWIVAYWLIKFALFLMLLWFIFFRLPTFF